MTSRFIRWFDHKYGVERKEHEWVKVHIMSRLFGKRALQWNGAMPYNKG